MYLQKRQRRYHFRMRVPTDLIGLVGAREVVRSLRTSDGRVARAQACLLRSELHGAFDQVRMKRRLGWSAEDLWLLIRPTLQSGDEIHAEKPRTLSWLMQQFLADRDGTVDKRTLLNVRYCLDLVLLVMGDMRLAELDRERCRTMRDTLIQLPKRVLQLYPGKSCAFILRQNLPPMNPKTANKAIHFFSSMLTWAERETLIDKHPARALTVSLRQRPSDERNAYTEDELGILFRGWSRLKGDPPRYWVPLIGLLSGMRLEEICQLRAKDFVEPSGIACFSIDPAAGALKTLAAERLVPVHNRLFELGLAGYVAGLDPKGRMWPSLKPDKYGKRSSAFSKWFGNHKRSAGLQDPKLTFHSLRHTFVNGLKQLEVAETVIAELVGHTNHSITLSRYGKRYNLPLLNKAVQAVDARGYK